MMRQITILLFMLFTLIMPLGAQDFPPVNQERLEQSLFALAEFGKKPNGEPNRVAFSDADIAGRNYVIGLMEDTGLEVTIDFAGNIIGRRNGSGTGMKPIAFGSHIDMVPDGGNYDGMLGSLAAIEVVKTLGENNIITRHPLEVLIFPNKEGGVMGSRALAGNLNPGALEVKNITGFTMAEGIDRIGGNALKVQEVKRSKGSLAAFLELHIEQGAILEKTATEIGVVEGIVGIKWWDVEVTGNANHAGTTPMTQRQDALLAASRFVIAVNDVAMENEGSHVATVGRISAEPGAPNVIPGRVLLSLEIRDLSSDKMNRLFSQLEQAARQIATTSGTSFKFSPIDATGEPALTDEHIRKFITEAANALGLTSRLMQSGAGHDAQEMASLAPVGMIFVPSKGGISHSPREFTSANDMANGANVLLHTLMAIDREWE